MSVHTQEEFDQVMGWLSDALLMLQLAKSTRDESRPLPDLWYKMADGLVAAVQDGRSDASQ